MMRNLILSVTLLFSVLFLTGCATVKSDELIIPSLISQSSQDYSNKVALDSVNGITIIEAEEIASRTMEKRIRVVLSRVF